MFLWCKGRDIVWIIVVQKPCASCPWAACRLFRLRKPLGELFRNFVSASRNMFFCNGHELLERQNGPHSGICQKPDVLTFFSHVLGMIHESNDVRRCESLHCNKMASSFQTSVFLYRHAHFGPRLLRDLIGLVRAVCRNYLGTGCQHDMFL